MTDQKTARPSPTAPRIICAPREAEESRSGTRLLCRIDEIVAALAPFAKAAGALANESDALHFPLDSFEDGFAVISMAELREAARIHKAMTLTDEGQ